MAQRHKRVGREQGQKIRERGRVRGQAGDALAAVGAGVPPMGWGAPCAIERQQLSTAGIAECQLKWDMDSVPTILVCPGPRGFPWYGTFSAETGKVLATQHELVT